MRKFHGLPHDERDGLRLQCAPRRPVRAGHSADDADRQADEPPHRGTGRSAEQHADARHSPCAEAHYSAPGTGRPNHISRRLRVRLTSAVYCAVVLARSEASACASHVSCCRCGGTWSRDSRSQLRSASRT